MKKRFIYHICGIMSFLLCLTSCTDYLDREPDSVISDTDAYKNFTTPAGEFVTAWDVSAWAGKYLQVSPDSITYGSSETYASITAGTTLMNAGTDGNLHIMASNTGISDGGVYFKVAKKIEFDGNGVLVEVIVK